jgi:hypothetical protein
MANQTLNEDYALLASSHRLYTRNRDRWQFLMESYVGGEEYRRSGHLIKYALETEAEYNRRLANTPLDNHCQSVIATYISFLFREEPEREFGMWEGQQDVKDFLNDCDYEGRSFDSFMKQVSIWSSVFGHCWTLMTKPHIGAQSLGEEQALGVRPYVNLLTPLVVSDWRWQRQANGSYKLVYFKYVEEVVDQLTIIREWTPEVINTWEMDDNKKSASLVAVEVNELGMIPAVLVYNQRSVVKGIGVSDISDIADLQRQIYCLTSEQEQSIRLDGHPSLVTPSTAQLGSGAGAIIQLQDGSDPGLNPYYLEHAGNGVASIHASMEKLIEAIDRISFTGGVRSTVTKTMSGVAMETEFALLNAKLSEKADMMELAEEQLWKLFGLYQGREWEGEIDYPSSFNIRDTQREFQQLAQAKSAATDPRVLAVIDHEIIELLGEDGDLILPEMVTLMTGETVPYDSAEPFEEPEYLYDPATGEEGWVIDFATKRDLMSKGWICKEYEGD